MIGSRQPTHSQNCASSLGTASPAESPDTWRERGREGGRGRERKGEEGRGREGGRGRVRVWEEKRV